MIETKDTSELFERLEREFADERHVLDEMERNVREVERLVPPEIAPRPSRTKKVVAGVVAGLAIAAAGVGAGMAIQYYGETQPAQEQVTTLQGEVATLNGYALYNAPSAEAMIADELTIRAQKAEMVAPAALPPLWRSWNERRHG
jgi:hypothetical protein